MQWLGQHDIKYNYTNIWHYSYKVYTAKWSENKFFGNTASKVWKQQTRFYWVCSWEIMADATSLTPPSPGLSAALLSNKSAEHYSPKRPENVNLFNNKRLEV